MKTLEKILLHACAFAVLISLCFFIVARIGTSQESITIELVQYLIILLFGVIIAITNTVFNLKVCHIVIRTLIHYVVLLVAFLIIFGNAALSLDSPADFFIATIVFTFLYAVFFAIAWLLKKSINKIDDKLEASGASHKKSNAKSENYNPRFK